MGEKVLFPVSALSVSGSKGMFSARIDRHPHCEFRCKSNHLFEVSIPCTKNATATAFKNIKTKTGHELHEPACWLGRLYGSLRDENIFFHRRSF
jgi:hypothetical protein